jgi:hypothetical protein
LQVCVVEPILQQSQEVPNYQATTTRHNQETEGKRK